MVDKIDIDNLKTASDDLSELSIVVDSDVLRKLFRINWSQK